MHSITGTIISITFDHKHASEKIKT